MGCHENISTEKFPKQGPFFNQRVQVCFNYDTSKTVDRKIVRDDVEDPHKTIIKLNNGNYVLSSECQYQLI